MIDFTFTQYSHLLLKKEKYFFMCFQDYLENYPDQFIILRHDVDRLPLNALQISKIEIKFGLRSTFFFRSIAQTFKVNIIKDIVEMGHEIGYHYENMDTCNGNIDKAWDDFRWNLDKFRKIYPVTTICMHGSPLSKYDNRDLWKKYDYRTEGIIGEPYLDVDWNDVFYLTDTGRRWNGENISVRDKVNWSHEKEERRWPIYRTTNDIIQAIENRKFPEKSMITTHPQRWTNNPLLWTKELVFQNIKNKAKSVLIKYNQ